jgi:hypothetical protein
MRLKNIKLYLIVWSYILFFIILYLILIIIAYLTELLIFLSFSVFLDINPNEFNKIDAGMIKFIYV